MPEVVIIDAVRSPIGRRNGGLSTMHPADLLAVVQKELIDRTGIDPAEVGQLRHRLCEPGRRAVVQRRRTAWLSAGLPMEVPATTVDTQCGSSQQGHQHGNRSGPVRCVDVAIGCGVEVMSRVPIGSNASKKLGFGIPIPKPYFEQYEMTSQFEGQSASPRSGISAAPIPTNLVFVLKCSPPKPWEEARFGGPGSADQRSRSR